MRAIVETGGMQFPVEENEVIRVPKIEAEVGQAIDFDKILLVSDKDKFAVGKPYIDGAKVSAEILFHGRADRIAVFKFKKRTKYRKAAGHRQHFTEIKIKSISA